MPAAASTEKRTSCLVFSSSFFFLRKDRKSPPDRPSAASHKNSSLTRQTKGKQDGSNREAPPTRNQLHDDVDWLSLRTDTNKLHNVRVVILFQDPAANHRQAVSDTSQSQTDMFIHVLLG